MTATAGVFLTKLLPTFLNKHRTFHTAPFFNQSGDYPSQGLAQPNSSLLQVLPGTPISLVSASTVPEDVYHPLCVSYFVSTPPNDFHHPNPFWCRAALPALVEEGAGALTLLPISCSRHQAPAAAAWVLVQIPGTLPSQRTLLTVCFSMSSAIFCHQTSYKLGFHWLVTLFLRRSARCSSWAQGKLGSNPTYVYTIFPLRTIK